MRYRRLENCGVDNGTVIYDSETKILICMVTQGKWKYDISETDLKKYFVQIDEENPSSRSYG